MSDDQAETVAPILRREALLPNERSRGLGTVAVVCTMAGVASGLALATTLMAMQVADSMSTRTCPYSHVEMTAVEVPSEHGFLGVRYKTEAGPAEVEAVLPGTPAASIALHPGDHILSVDGIHISSGSELKTRMFDLRPGSTPSIVIERDGEVRTYRPTLVSWPVITY